MGPAARTVVSMRLASAASINQHACTRRFRQSADPLPQNDRFSAFFAQWVCSLANTLPHVRASPLPIGGIALHEAPTRRRHAPGRLHVVQKPPPFPACRAPRPSDTRPRCRYARKYSPNAAPPTALPRQSSPSKPKNTNFGVFSARWANFFALTHTPSQAGRKTSHTGRSDVATLKPTTPLQPKNTLKIPISHPQRR